MENHFSNMNDWNDLRCFVEVARASGLSQAANKLGISPATAGRRIDALEQVLGVHLFIRRQTGYFLTDDGERVFAEAQIVEQAMLAFTRRTNDAANTGRWSGHIRVACPELVASHWITPRLGAFLAEHRGLTVELIVGTEQVNLSKRVADVAIRFTEPRRDEEGDYVVTKLGNISFAAYSAIAIRSGVNDWRDLPYISWGDSGSHLTIARWLKAEFSGRKPVFVSNSLNQQYVGARAGLGVVVIPTYIGDKDAGLMRIEPEHEVTSRPLWMVFHRDLRSSERLVAMRNFLTSLF